MSVYTHTSVTVCPWCLAHKHYNCNQYSWDAATGSDTPCPCYCQDVDWVVGEVLDDDVLPPAEDRDAEGRDEIRRATR